MKKSILFSMALVAALSSCTKENVDNNNGNNDLVPIVLGTSPKISGTVTPQSRAPLNSWSSTEVGLYALAKNSGVTWTPNPAVDDDPVLWNNVTGTIANGDAGTVQSISVDTDKEYYPKNGTMQYSFYGYYPIGAGVQTNLTESSVTATFTIDGTQDIIWGKAVAEAIGDVEGYNAEYFQQEGADEKIPQIDFKHLLTQLNFQFKREDGFAAGQNIQVQSITINNVSNSLTLTVANKTDDGLSGSISDNNITENLQVSITPEESNPGIPIDNSATAVSVGDPIMLFTDADTKSFSGEIVLVDGNTGKPMTTEPISFTIGVDDSKSTPFEAGTSYTVEFTILDMQKIVVNTKLDTWKTGKVIQGGNI